MLSPKAKKEEKRALKKCTCRPNYSPSHNVFERRCEAFSGNFAFSAQNCLTSTFKYIVMQMRKVNCEKGYCDLLIFHFPTDCFVHTYMLQNTNVLMNISARNMCTSRSLIYLSYLAGKAVPSNLYVKCFHCSFPNWPDFCHLEFSAHDTIHWDISQGFWNAVAAN